MIINPLYYKHSIADSDRRQSAPRNFRFSEHFSLCLSRQTFTSTISLPIDFIQWNGMTYTNSLPKTPHSLAGPGTMIELMQPLDGSKSMSITHPRIRQSFSLMTCLFLRSYIFIQAKNSFLMFHLLQVFCINHGFAFFVLI